MSFFLQLRRGLSLMLLFTLLLGLCYPLLMTGIGHLVFPKQTSGSLILNSQGVVIGSALIGQNFQNPKYFWGRPSSTSPAYNPQLSTGSNLSPTNPVLLQNLIARIKNLQAQNPDQAEAIPIDLITSSASGLDPDISVASAEYQALRIAKARHMPVSTIEQLIVSMTSSRQLGFFGEPRVNVLMLNLQLDKLASSNA